VNSESAWPGHFFRTVIDGTDAPVAPRSHMHVTASPFLSRVYASLEDVTHYRLVPGSFPRDMPFHFDGLATVMSFQFHSGMMTRKAKHFDSNLYKHTDRCIFLGTGTGPWIGVEPCLTNPAVNLLPINGQLWLTIDTAAWGRVDPETLETISNSSVDVPSLVLNAHPACDPHTAECFVQHPCSAPGALPLSQDKPWSKIACISKLVTTDGPQMKTVLYSNATMPEEKIIQHSHSPCITPNFVVSKLDSFGPRLKLEDSGMLKELHQVQDALWQVMDRRTNVSYILSSNLKFVNNHFWNCIERDGDIVVDTIPATSNYLDTYFKSHLSKPTDWASILMPPQRCVIDLDSESRRVVCSTLLQGHANETTFFDYPTFNPLFKMNPEYLWTYAIAPVSPESRWFDRLIKIHSPTGHIAASWSAPNVYVSEADFVPHSGAVGEDDGLLISVLYNATADTSSLAIFNATSLEPVIEYPLSGVVPFHAHGIVCTGAKCFSNP